MNAMREPESARDLRRALVEFGAPERRHNPPESVGNFVVSIRPAGPGQQWRELGRFPDRDVALDEAASPFVSGFADGGLVRLVGGGLPTWLGVMDGGSVHEAPSVPRNEPSGETDWVEAWDGPRAEARWMVERCSGVPHQQVALALAACVATRLPLADGALEGRRLALRQCLRVARSWAAGDADMRAIDKASEVASDFRDQVGAGRWPGAGPAYEVADAVVAVLAYVRWRDRPADTLRALRTASRRAFELSEARPRSGRMQPERDWTGFDMRFERSMAPRVRSFVPLGDVLLSERKRLGVKR
jgi:hypothetical protein